MSYFFYETEFESWAGFGTGQHTPCQLKQSYEIKLPSQDFLDRRSLTCKKLR